MSNTENAPIYIVPERTSCIGDVEVMRQALHEDIEIKCFYEGTATLLVGTQTISVKAGDVVVINPYEFHATVYIGEENARGRYHLFMIPLDYFSGGELDLRYLFFAQKKAFQTLFSQDAALFRLLMLAAEESILQQPACRSAIRALMMELFVALLRKGLRSETSHCLPRETLRAHQLMEPALRYIRDHYADPVQIGQLAELCQVSKHYFCRVFKAVTGLTAMEYLRVYRLKVADTLLGNTNKSIGQIAEICGFESTNYFCRCYKKHYGVSPSKRRSSMQF